MNAFIVLSRLDSHRLARKALRYFGDKMLIEWCVDELKNMKDIEVILATTNRNIDDELIDFAKMKKIEYFRGDALNVAKRVGDCIEYFGIKNFARVNADSPFLQGKLISKGFDKINDYDFVTNLIPRTFPYGISIEIFKSSVFLKNIKLFNSFQKEHITSYFYDNLEKFNPFFIINSKGNHNEIRLTIDEKRDADIFEKMLSFDKSITSKSLETILEVYSACVKIS